LGRGLLFRRGYHYLGYLLLRKGVGAGFLCLLLLRPLGLSFGRSRMSHCSIISTFGFALDNRRMDGLQF
jgi:hypothetical protein